MIRFVILISLVLLPMLVHGQQDDQVLMMYQDALNYIKSDSTIKRYLSNFFDNQKVSIKPAIEGGEHLGLRKFTRLILSNQINCIECQGCNQSLIKNTSLQEQDIKAISDSLSSLEKQLLGDRYYKFESAEDFDKTFEKLPQEMKDINANIVFSYPTKDIITGALFYYKGKISNNTPRLFYKHMNVEVYAYNVIVVRYLFLFNDNQLFNVFRCVSNN